MSCKTLLAHILAAPRTHISRNSLYKPIICQCITHWSANDRSALAHSAAPPFAFPPSAKHKGSSSNVMKMTGFVLILESKRQKTERMESRLKYTCVPAIPSQFASRSYFSYNNYLFFELDKVGRDNGRFRLTPRHQNKYSQGYHTSHRIGREDESGSPSCRASLRSQRTKDYGFSL